MFKRLREMLFGSSTSKNDRRLLDQYFVTLNATYQKAKEGNTDVEEYKDLTVKIEELLKGEKSWKNAYNIEQLMVPLYDDETLEVEFRRNLVDAKSALNEDVHAYYQEASQTTEKSEKQALLNRIINDLQWRVTVRELYRNYASLTRIRTGLVFFLAVLLFLVPGFLFTKVMETLQLQYLGLAIRAGLLGAAFSMLISLNEIIKKSSLQELRVQYRYDFLIVRVITGIGATLIFFYFLQADLLSGSFFPDITDPDKAGDFKNQALLVVWSFLAGFSEKFVPNLLSKTEEKIEVKGGN